MAKVKIIIPEVINIAAKMKKAKRTLFVDIKNTNTGHKGTKNDPMSFTDFVAHSTGKRVRKQEPKDDKLAKFNFLCGG
jgi:hypothetical protein